MNRIKLALFVQFCYLGLNLIQPPAETSRYSSITLRKAENIFIIHCFV
jgi:hypothetical protein